MQPEPFNADAHAAETASHGFETGSQAGNFGLETAIQPAAPTASQPLFPTEASLRHGKIAGRSLAIGYQRSTGKDLDKEVADTAGEAMGEVFAAVAATGSKLIYWSLLLLALLPVLLAIIRECVNTTREATHGS